MIFGTLVYNDISRPFFLCFKIFIFCAVRGLKGKSIARLYPNTFVYSCSLPRLSFFTVCLNNYLHEVLPRWAPKWNFLNFRSPYCWKIYFWHSLWLQKHSLHIFIGSFMRLSFITQFKIEFLQLFTGCTKVVGKMPDSPKWK